MPSPSGRASARSRGGTATEYELELKAIVQKNFLADRLVWAANLTFEPEWEREPDESAPGVLTSDTEQELAIEASTGLSYQLARGLWVGAESRYHSVYPDWTSGLHRENDAIYAGPTIHYGAGKWRHHSDVASPALRLPRREGFFVGAQRP